MSWEITKKVLSTHKDLDFSDVRVDLDTPGLAIFFRKGPGPIQGGFKFWEIFRGKFITASKLNVAFPCLWHVFDIYAQHVRGNKRLFGKPLMFYNSWRRDLQNYIHSRIGVEKSEFQGNFNTYRGGCFEKNVEYKFLFWYEQTYGIDLHAEKEDSVMIIKLLENEQEPLYLGFSDDGFLRERLPDGKRGFIKRVLEYKTKVGDPYETFPDLNYLIQIGYQMYIAGLGAPENKKASGYLVYYFLTIEDNEYAHKLFKVERAEQIKQEAERMKQCIKDGVEFVPKKSLYPDYTEEELQEKHDQWKSKGMEYAGKLVIFDVDIHDQTPLDLDGHTIASYVEAMGVLSKFLLSMVDEARENYINQLCAFSDGEESDETKKQFVEHNGLEYSPGVDYVDMQLLDSEWSLNSLAMFLKKVSKHLYLKHRFVDQHKGVNDPDKYDVNKFNEEENKKPDHSDKI